MISEYYRPKTIDQTLLLLTNPGTRPIGGGTFLNQPSDSTYIGIDLQELGLDKIRKAGDKLDVGATATLQSLKDNNHTQVELKKAINHEASVNIRNVATVAGSLVACNGRSPFLTTLLALNPTVDILPGEQEISLGDFLPLRSEYLHGKLITNIILSSNLNLAYDYVARSPKDKPIICVAMVRWSSGRTRVVLGGWGRIPSLAMDGRLLVNEVQEVLQKTIQSTTHDSSDEWASAEYRCAAAIVLANRCLNKLTNI